MRSVTGVAGITLLLGAIGTAHGQQPCQAMLDEARGSVRDFRVWIDVPSGVTAGSAIKVKWNSSNRNRAARLPYYFVVAAPFDTRLAGIGFIGLAAGALGPDQITAAQDWVRGIVPLHRLPQATTTGEIIVRPFRAGQNTLAWALIAGGPCGQTILNRGERSVEVRPGAPSLVLQENFSAEKPVKRLRSPQGKYDLLLFDRRYEVHDNRTGAKLVDRAGLEPNFSPTGRFIAARGVADTRIDIIDLVSGERISGGDQTLAWSRGDSLVVGDLGGNGVVSVQQTVVDGNGFSSNFIGCRVCAAYGNTKLHVDFDKGYAAAYANHGAWAVDLTTKKDWKVESLNSTEAAFKLQLEEQVRKRFDPRFVAPATGWNLGEQTYQFTHLFSHQFMQSKPSLAPGTSLVVHQTVTDEAPAVPRQQQAAVLVGGDFRGRGTRSAQDTNASPLLLFGRLESADIKTESAVGTVNRITDSDEDLRIASDKQLPGKRDRAVADIIRNIPAAQATFAKQEGFQCDVQETSPSGETLVPSNHITQIHQWSDKNGAHALVQSVCFAGSAAMVNYADLVLFSAKATGKKIRSVGSIVAGKDRWAFHGYADSNFLAFPGENGFVILASRAQRIAAVLNIATSAREGAIIKPVQTELLRELRRTTDGRHLVQLNSDNRFYIFRIQDGRQVLNGAIVDDEVVVATDDGLYDTTYEGAHAVQVRFAGVPGLYSFHQFEAKLRRKGLAQQILSGSRIDQQPTSIATPPRIRFTVAASANNGRRAGTVIAESERNLAQLRFYLDGRHIETQGVQGTKVERPVALPDAGGGRWISVVAVDEDGLVSLPSSVRIPGQVSPVGVLRAVIVGVDNYQDPKLKALKSAQADARNLSTALNAEWRRSFARFEQNLLLDRQATPAAFLNAIKQAAEQTVESDTLVLFFAGHAIDGGQEGQPAAGLALTTSQTRSGALLETAVPWASIAAQLGNVRGKVIIILDACHSGLAGSGALTTNDALVDNLFTKSGAPIIVLASSKGRQLSGENQQGGFFTSAIVSVLTKNRQAADLNQSGLLDLSELYRAVKSQVMTQTAQEQTPWLARNVMVGDISLF